MTEIIRATCPVCKVQNMVQALYKYIPKTKLIEILITMGQACMVKLHRNKRCRWEIQSVFITSINV